MQEIQASLPAGAVIHGQYIVESLLGKGDFGSIYLVRDQHNKQKLFVLAEVVNPKEKESYRFTFEYISITPLHHRALPHSQYFFKNDKLNRAYLLMSYIEEPNLEILRLQQAEKRFPLPKVMDIMAPVIDAVTYLHHRSPPVIHRNIKPFSIVPANVDRPVLVMLGIIKEHDSTTTTLHYLAPGYGATEQYTGEFGARTDIYGLGATFYTLLTGIIPADACYRSTQLSNGEIDPLKPLNEVIPTVPTFMTEAIQQAMSVNANDRFSSLEQFREVLWSSGKQFSPRISPSMLSTSSPSHMASTQTVERPAPASEPGQLDDAVSDTTTSKVEWPAPPSVAKQPRTRRAWKPGGVFIVLAILISLGIGVDFWSSARSLPAAHSATLAPTAKRSTPTPVPSIYPTLAETYIGTLYNIPQDLKTKMTLTGIQQIQRNIRGYFTGFQANGLQVNEPFSGMIDVHGHIHFTVAEYGGQIILAFDGSVLSGGTLVGNYCSLGQNGQCAGEYGLWSVVLTSS